MPKYKITKVSIVVAPSKAEALRLIEATADEALEFLSIVEQPAESNGLMRAVRSQVTGT